jgi:hypothetical protein
MCRPPARSTPRRCSDPSSSYTLTRRPTSCCSHLNRFSIGVRLAVYTRDIAEAFELARHARALSVHINDTPTLPIDPVVRGDLQEHHMCFEDMLQRIERLSQPKYVGFGKMALF